ncbi:MAG: DNA-3-methyladenine glycosylase 2 family protein [Roseitalea sp.]|jgi:DNA-3-methyladenine glycosylase II|nr:DNA-3-methyladenine glycosylase 2 family protein [Roseitalea sp.]MBO6722613.1 DNA-3-methyladenine glycosylase 2 family protein [Roseitalea sp.]MBO6745098.1 DNA-3-methyladenine glycosylase 2 family protein [Roseitalea sp.]
MSVRQTIETHDDIAAGLTHLARTDTALARLVDDVDHVPLRRTTPGFSSLAGIIVSQQVSRQSADAITGRMVRLVDPLTPDNFMAAGESAWKEIGLSRPKQRAMSAICEAIGAGTLDLDGLCMIEAEAAIAAMTEIKGIGPWTAEVYLLFAAGHRDIFPAGDLALQVAAAAVYGLDDRPDDKTLRAMAESWSPWRGVAARLLWAWYGQTTGRAVLP